MIIAFWFAISFVIFLFGVGILFLSIRKAYFNK
jgi:hypothetical protein